MGDLEDGVYDLVTGIIKVPFKVGFWGAKKVFGVGQNAYYAYQDKQEQLAREAAMPKPHPERPATEEENKEAVRMMRVAEYELLQIEKQVAALPNSNKYECRDAIHRAQIALNKARAYDYTAEYFNEEHAVTWTIDQLTALALSLDARLHIENALDEVHHKDKKSGCEKAVALIRQAQHVFPAKHYKAMEADILRRKGDHKGALAIINDLLKDDPDNLDYIRFRERLRQW